MRAPQNFAKVVTAIPALVQRGIKVRIATTVESIEDAELDRLCALHRGRCRSVLITARIGAGAHACSLFLRTMSMITAATASGVVASGAASIPSVIRLRTNPGRNHPHVHPERSQRLGQPRVEGIQTGLGRAVDEVRPAGAFGRHGGKRHDRAVSLGLQTLRQQHTHRHGADVVGLGQRDGGVHVDPGLLLVTEHAEGHQRHVDVTAGEATVDRRRVTAGHPSVEVHIVDEGGWGRRLVTSLTACFLPDAGSRVE